MGDEVNVPGGESPERVAVRAEVSEIMTDPRNPRHQGWTQGDPAVRKYIDGLYAKLPGGDRKVDISGGIVIAPAPEGSTGRQDRSEGKELTADEARTVQDLKATWGESFPENFTAAQLGYDTLMQSIPAEIFDQPEFEELVGLVGNVPGVIQKLAAIGKKLRAR